MARVFDATHVVMSKLLDFHGSSFYMLQIFIALAMYQCTRISGARSNDIVLDVLTLNQVISGMRYIVVHL